MTVHDQLRSWAKGMYTIEAATELLIRAFDGRFADPGYPWIQPTDHNNGYWVDFAVIGDRIDALSGGEQRLLRIAASIGSSEVMVNLSDDISGLDRPTLRLVLAAIAHAAGSHEHSDMVIDHDKGTYVIVRESSLYAWDDHATSNER